MRSEAAHRPGGGPYVHPDPVTDAALDWFVRLREGHVDPAASAEFEAWLEEDGRHAEAYARLEAMHALPAMRMAGERDARRLGLGAAASAGSAAPAARPKRRWIAGVTAIAATLIVALGVQQYPEMMLRLRADHLTSVGERQSFTLPDGSSVTLNTASAIAVDFTDGRRAIALLKGEAFFDVRSNPTHPFVVTSQFGTVTVKGTAFAVRRDAERDLVVLERGRVDVGLLWDASRNAQLEPAQMVVATETALSPVSAVDPDRQLAWLKGRIAFSDQPFGSALAELDRYYSGRILVATDRLDGVLINGNYRLDDPEAAIRTLAEAAGGSMTRLPGGVIILR